MAGSDYVPASQQAASGNGDLFANLTSGPSGDFDVYVGPKVVSTPGQQTTTSYNPLADLIGGSIGVSTGFNPLSGVTQYGPQASGYGTATQTQAVKQNATQLLAGLYRSPDRVTELQQQLSDAGYLSSKNVSGTIDQYTRSAFMNLLWDTHLQNTNDPSNMLTPDELLAERIKTQKAAGLGGGAGGSQNSRRVTSVNYSDPAQAQRLIEAAMAKELGRNPTAGELSQFKSALAGAEAASPTVTTESGLTGSSPTQTTSGGLDVQQFATNYVRSHNGDESAAYKGATTYFNAAMSALGGVV